MSLWRHVRHGFRALLDRETTDHELADEVDHYMAEALQSLIASGVPPQEAKRRLVIEFGGSGAVRATVRSYGWENAVETAASDVRLALRRLRRSPGFTAAAVLTLGLGIGATTSIFSAVRPVLLEPLPYPASDELVEVTDRDAAGAPVAVAFGSYRELVTRSRGLEAAAVARPWMPTVTEGGEPERLTGQRVSAGYFRVLGVSPASGPSFDPSYDRPGGPKVVVLSDRLWRTRFGADSAIVGRRIELNGVPHAVVGVMPPGFENVLAPSASVWTLLQYDAAGASFEGPEWGHNLRMVGRLRDHSTPREVETELARIAASPVEAFPRASWADLGNGLSVDPLKDVVTRAAKPGLLAVTVSVALLLVIACVNVANLLIARGIRQGGEFAMRTALGAGRGRLLRQVLTESLLLSIAAGLVGAALAALGVKALVAVSPADLPRLDAIELDGVALATTFALAAVVGVVVGLPPALRARLQGSSGLRQSSVRSSARGASTRGALIVAQVSLTLVLLVAAGLLLRSLNELFAVDPGFDPSGVATLQVQAAGPRYDDDDATHRFFDEALEAVRSVPGVLSAALTSQLPLSGESDVYGVQPESSEAGHAEADLSAHRYVVSPGYFEAMGIPLMRGRPLEPADRAGAPGAVVVSASLASRLFQGGDALGQRLHVGRLDLPWLTVVGVVGDTKQLSLAGQGVHAVYVTPGQWYFADPARWLVVRTAGEPGELIARVKEAIWSVDATVPVTRVATMQDLVAASAAERRFAFRVFQAFGLAALLLSGLGLYGVLSGAVAERTRELGVRSALGATRQNLVRLVLREGLSLTAIGIALGVGIALAITRALDALLFGISPLDPVTYLGVVAMLAFVAMAASAIPAWRGSRVSPSTALRQE